MSFMHALLIALACSLAVGLIEWQLLRRSHGRALAELKEHHRLQHRSATQMLTQCRRQIQQLQAELDNARALLRRRPLRVVETVPTSLQVRAKADHSWPAGAFQPAQGFADTMVDEGLALATPRPQAAH